MKIQLSFIIPVYNVERYLQECIDSVKKQMDDTCEIVLIDDGSTDNSGMICDKNISNNIRVFHKTNGGLSSARNEGLVRSRGEYVAFVDSDDRIAEDSVQSILEWIDQGGADYCFMKGKKFFSDGKEIDLGDGISRNDILGLDHTSLIKYLSERPKYAASVCTKIYRKSFLEVENIKFPEDRRLSEDLGITRDCICKAKSIYALDIPYYEYRQNRLGSITYMVSKRTVDGILEFVKDTCEMCLVERKPISTEDRYIMSFAAYELSMLILDYSNCEIEVKKYIKEQFRQYKWVLSFARMKRIKMVKWCIRLFGLGFTSKLINAVK